MSWEVYYSEVPYDNWGGNRGQLGIFECWKEKRLKVPDGSLLDGLACISPDLDFSAAKQTVSTLP